MDTILSVEKVSYHFSPASFHKRGLRKREPVRAVDQISFNVTKGEILGLVGESGCGKSTLAKNVVRLYEPMGGKIALWGSDITHLSQREMLPYRKKMQMIFQNPNTSLNPKQRAIDIIREPMLFHSVTDSAEMVFEKSSALLKRVGLGEEHFYRYSHQFSGGQRQRIGIARALAVEPSFIIADEPISALDVSIQAQILNLLMDLRDEFHLSYLFIAHDLKSVKHVSNRMGVMLSGRLIEIGETEQLFHSPAHPYTRLLLSSMGETAIANGVALQTQPASPYREATGCPFYGRCPERRGLCAKESPPERELREGHRVSCFFS